MISWLEHAAPERNVLGGMSMCQREPGQPGQEGRRTPIYFVPVVWWELSHVPAVCLMAVREGCWLSPQFRDEDMSQEEAA